MPLIQYLSRILFDFGAVSGLGEEIERLGLGWKAVPVTPDDASMHRAWLNYNS